MKNLINWLLTLYVLIILAWSGFLKAESIQITDSKFDQKNLALTLSGVATGACDLKVQSQLSQTNEVFVFVTADDQQTTCIPEESTRIFSFVLDVRSFNLNPGTTYNIKINSSTQSEITQFQAIIPEHSQYPNYNSIRTTGILNVTADGQWFLVSPNKNFVMLRTSLDLSRYLGQRVRINGTEILHLTGPDLMVEEHNPLRAIQSQKGPEVFLLSISAATY